MKVLFVYDHTQPHLWQDGLWRALKELEKEWTIKWANLRSLDGLNEPADFILGWGAFSSPVDIALKQAKGIKKGICIGGNAAPPTGIHEYDVLFYETEWYKPQIEDHPNTVHAFGTNTDIYKPIETIKLFDYMTVGAFALWKRQQKLTEKPGYKLAIGEIQQDNMDESMAITDHLLDHGVAVSDMVVPHVLARLYNASQSVYIPADVNGGGERAVLEARACGVPVEVEADNPKLQELCESPVYDHNYYARQLKAGIESCLSQ